MWRERGKRRKKYQSAPTQRWEILKERREKLIPGTRNEFVERQRWENVRIADRVRDEILIREVFMLQNRPTQSYPPFVSARWRKPQIEMSVHMIFSFRFVPWHERLYLYMYLFRLLTLALCIWFISWWAYKCEYEKQETSFRSLGIRRWRERREKRRKYMGKLSNWATLSSFERRKTVLECMWIVYG